ncbi:penicillin-binding protein activator [Pseudomonas sp. ABC1]|uniref:penicillin-binding protein activator n=1 Tax=Pseudomonas sp. ABC1 TaxID=2748080 RepID=UPI0015C35F12|nr:penicillin-binding protein activator [Pseudomonas sp. ABC1]QLF95001.1 penicillin-binding protein activator [Pseudomonas sp. ABC1]
MACLRPLLTLCLAALVVACSSSPSSTLGELPRTPQASTQQLLQQAQDSAPEKAAQLRLSAAQQSYQQGNLKQAVDIIRQIDLKTLKPAQQIFARTLTAEQALADGQPKQALDAFRHAAFERLAELPANQQIQSRLVRAQALEADKQPLAAARERVELAPLLIGVSADDNHEAIWRLVSSLPDNDLHATGDATLVGWLNLGNALKQAGTLGQQQNAIDSWRQQYPQHPAALRLPAPLDKLLQLEDQPLNHIALLLPTDGPLAGPARALRDGFLTAHLQSETGRSDLKIELYDSSRITSIDEFYQRASRDGVQLIVGPLEKEQVRKLAERQSLPLPTLALNYSDAGQVAPPQLFQFGLAAEDEAREVARRAWADGHRRAIALTTQGEWGNRVLQAFRQSWAAQGGTLVAAESLGQPVELAGQIARLLQLTSGDTPTRRQDVDFLFLAATPQQAQQVKPTLVFQYADDLPVYATSHLFSANNDRAQYLDLEGIRFAETPWLLDSQLPLRLQVEQKWPQAGSSLGRLYAMGADAYLLAPRLNQLLAMPETELEGLSGTLTLSPERRIERRLPWAQFHNGQIERLDDTP